MSTHVTALVKAVAESKPTKSKTICKVLWEAKAVREKRDNIKKHPY